MKRLLSTLGLVALTTTAMAQYVDDLYDLSPAKPKKKKADNSYTYTQHEQGANNKQQNTAAFDASFDAAVDATIDGEPTKVQELITSYDAALQRRLSAMRSAVEMDDSYWRFMQQYQAILEMKYDKNLYNIVVVGNEMWVEPQYITALFDGSDPTKGVAKYNKQVKGQISSSTAKSDTKPSINGGGEAASAATNLTIVVQVESPWYWNNSPYWGASSYMYRHGGYYGWSDPWYNPWYNSCYSPWHNSWYNPWYNPHYSTYYPTYSGNPRGTYYGNSDYRYASTQSGGGLGGARQPRGSGDTFTNSARPTRGEATTALRPTGSNTVSGIGGRAARIRGDVPTNSQVPMGGVADMREAGISIGGFTPVRERGNRGDGNYARPVVGGSSTPTVFNRPSRDGSVVIERIDRNTYERPVERPASYDRTTTYERPITNTSRPTYYDQGGRGSGGAARPAGGSFGGGGTGGTRPAGGRGR